MKDFYNKNLDLTTGILEYLEKKDRKKEATDASRLTPSADRERAPQNHQYVINRSQSQKAFGNRGGLLRNAGHLKTRAFVRQHQISNSGDQLKLEALLESCENAYAEQNQQSIDAYRAESPTTQANDMEESLIRSTRSAMKAK